MTTAPPARRWVDMPTTAFGPAARDWVAVLPLAAVEQHGPHLPVGVDLMVAEGLADRVIADLPPASRAVFLPAMAIGKSDEHRAFPGTLTLNWDTTIRWMLEVGASVARAGPRTLVLVTSHGGNVPAMEIAARDLREQCGLRVVTTAWGRLRDAGDLHDPATAAFDIHAGAAETAWMLALRPDLVRTDLARDFASPQRDLAVRNRWLGYHGARANIAWLAQDLNPDGPSGNAAIANAAQGAEDLRRIVAGFIELLAEIEALPHPTGGPDA